MNPPYLLEMYKTGNDFRDSCYELLQSVDSEGEAVRLVKTTISFMVMRIPDSKKFRLFMGEGYGYKYYNFDAGEFQF